MMVLGSKIFDISGNDGLTALRDSLYRWLLSLGDLTGERIVVSVKTAGDRRSRKQAAARQLEELVAENVDKPAVWERYSYRFCFSTRRYFWNDEEIYVTANEALFLYRWLVLEDGVDKIQRRYLWNIRHRLGKVFLKEL